MAGATRTIVINAPIEKVFSVVSDLESYPKFLPEVKKIQITRESPDTVVADYEVDMMKRVKYSLRLKSEAPRRLSWTWVRGEFMKDNQGSWALEPLSPTQTQVTYTIEVTLGALVPKSMVNALVDTQLPKMLEAFKARAEGA